MGSLASSHSRPRSTPRTALRDLRECHVSCYCLGSQGGRTGTVLVVPSQARAAPLSPASTDCPLRCSETSDRGELSRSGLPTHPDARDPSPARRAAALPAGLMMSRTSATTMPHNHTKTAQIWIIEFLVYICTQNQTICQRKANIKIRWVVLTPLIIRSPRLPLCANKLLQCSPA